MSFHPRPSPFKSLISIAEILNVIASVCVVPVNVISVCIGWNSVAKDDGAISRAPGLIVADKWASSFSEERIVEATVQRIAKQNALQGYLIHEMTSSRIGRIGRFRSMLQLLREQVRRKLRHSLQCIQLLQHLSYR